jgi:hypothetical protein
MILGIGSHEFVEFLRWYNGSSEAGLFSPNLHTCV